MKHPDGTRGVALLEVLVALTIFGIAALSTLERLAQLSDTQRQSQARETALADQDRLMTAMSLLTREDLDLRLGSRTVGALLVEVQRPRATLYRVEISREGAALPDLTTLLYRPEPRRAL